MTEGTEPGDAVDLEDALRELEIDGYETVFVKEVSLLPVELVDGGAAETDG